MSGCPICGWWWAPDPSTGAANDGLCPECVEDGYEEAPCGCLTTPTKRTFLCAEHSSQGVETEDSEIGESRHDVA